MPVGVAVDVGGLDVGQRRDRRRCASEAEPVAALRRRASATDSTSVFQASQCGHLPSHLGLVPPHSVQV